MFVKGFSKTAGLLDKIKGIFKAPVARTVSKPTAQAASQVYGYRADKSPITTKSGLNLARRTGSVRYSDMT